jgi:cytosine/adenosine deaminase-related metal-dependent hydrolase
MTDCRILLKGGTLLLHDDQDHVHWQKLDLLILGNTIATISENIKVESDVQVIDCGGKLISPGFIDTHQHVWQAAFKGIHCDENLVQYFASGMMKL